MGHCHWWLIGDSMMAHWCIYLNSAATRFWTSVPPCPLGPGSLRKDCAKFARFLTISTHSILHSGISECAPPHAHEITTIDSIGTRRCCMAVWASFVRNKVILLIIKPSLLDNIKRVTAGVKLKSNWALFRIH